MQATRPYIEPKYSLIVRKPVRSWHEGHMYVWMSSASLSGRFTQRKWYHSPHSSHLIMGDPSSGFRHRQCTLDALLVVRGLLLFALAMAMFPFSLLSTSSSLDIMPWGTQRTWCLQVNLRSSLQGEHRKMIHVATASGVPTVRVTSSSTPGAKRKLAA